ncbi:MAG TPA: HAMP domain-containing histidine kinase [Desulfitobacterium dehalogenans]|uniref:histidine kinase n=1 Tax=Desulfitobacterium dehalogenans TaxID=36854 RepID=A0A7C7D538_9FIRM|nr:HAMP domain-containing histidine kinase [Desulfitobacterium dehalogenans]
MKKKIYLRTFGWLMGIWLVFMIGFTVFVFSVEENKIKDEFLNYTNSLSVNVERIFNDYKESNKEKVSAYIELSRQINNLTSHQGYEAAIYTGDRELIGSTNDHWFCQYTAYREGNIYYSGYAFLDPQKWFSEEQIAEMEEYLYVEHNPQNVGDLWHYVLDIEGFWLDGAEIIPDTIRVTKLRADSFNEKGMVVSGSGTFLTTPVYQSNYVDSGDLPYYVSGHITRNNITYPNGKIGLRSDERQTSMREAVLDKNSLEKAIDNYFISPVTEIRTGFTYRFYTPYPYQSTINGGEDGRYTSKYWIVTANEFNILTDVLPILIVVWISCFVIFAIVAGILSAQTWKTFRSREELEQQRRDMTNAIAHDLKTPLAVISGYAENLAENIHTEKREHYAAGIQENVRRCDRMVKDMLDLSCMESGGVIFALDQVSLREITEEILSRYAEVFSLKEMTSTVEGTAEIRADRQLMERALDNFVSNAAAHAVVGGTVQVNITAHWLSVSNTGSPIPAKELGLIWRAYYKLDKSRMGSGSGLGLSIVRSIMDLHGFKYGAENTETGVCFWFEW